MYVYIYIYIYIYLRIYLSNVSFTETFSFDNSFNLQVCMHVCMYVCVCVCIHIHMYIYIYIYTHTLCLCGTMASYMQAYTHRHACMHTHRIDVSVFGGFVQDIVITKRAHRLGNHDLFVSHRPVDVCVCVCMYACMYMQVYTSPQTRESLSLRPPQACSLCGFMYVCICVCVCIYPIQAYPKAVHRLGKDNLSIFGKDNLSIFGKDNLSIFLFTLSVCMHVCMYVF